MGAESKCAAHFNGQTSEGKAQLETDFLLFRGDFRVKVPFEKIRALTIEGGQLRIQISEGTLQLDLGPAASKWLQKIRNPPNLLDKLGIKPGMAVSVSGIRDQAFLDSLNGVGLDTKSKPDFILTGLETAEELPKIAEAASGLSPTSALWAV